MRKIMKRDTSARALKVIYKLIMYIELYMQTYSNAQILFVSLISPCRILRGAWIYVRVINDEVSQQILPCA